MNKIKLKNKRWLKIDNYYYEHVLASSQKYIAPLNLLHLKKTQPMLYNGMDLEALDE